MPPGNLVHFIGTLTRSHLSEAPVAPSLAGSRPVGDAGPGGPHGRNQATRPFPTTTRPTRRAGPPSQTPLTRRTGARKTPHRYVLRDPQRRRPKPPQRSAEANRESTACTSAPELLVKRLRCTQHITTDWQLSVNAPSLTGNQPTTATTNFQPLDNAPPLKRRSSHYHH